MTRLSVEREGELRRWVKSRVAGHAGLSDLLAELDAVREEHDDLCRRVMELYPPEPGEPLPIRFKGAGPTEVMQRASNWFLAKAIHVLFREMQAQEPELRNRLTMPIIQGDEAEPSYHLTLARGKYESAMETQRNEARSERDALAAERDDLQARLLDAQEAVAHWEAWNDGQTSLLSAPPESMTPGAREVVARIRALADADLQARLLVMTRELEETRSAHAQTQAVAAFWRDWWANIYSALSTELPAHGTTVLNPEFGPQSPEEERVYQREELVARLRSLVARAEAAEAQREELAAALEHLREVASDVRKYRDYSGPPLGAWGVLERALALPTSEAAATARRGWEAKGIEEAADFLDRRALLAGNRLFSTALADEASHVRLHATTKRQGGGT